MLGKKSEQILILILFYGRREAGEGSKKKSGNNKNLLENLCFRENESGWTRFSSGWYVCSFTAGSHYCCTAQDSLNGDQLTAHFEVHLEKHA